MGLNKVSIQPKGKGCNHQVGTAAHLYGDQICYLPADGGADRGSVNGNRAYDVNLISFLLACWRTVPRHLAAHGARSQTVAAHSL